MFTLSAIHPNMYSNLIETIYSILNTSGLILLRDFGMYDIGMIKNHKRGNKFD